MANEQTVALTLEDLSLDVARAVLDLIEGGEAKAGPAKKGKVKKAAAPVEEDDVDEDEDEDDEWDDEEDDDDEDWDDEDEEDDEDVTAEDLDDMDFKALKAFAAEKGVKFKKGTKSPGLRKAIIEQVFADEEEEEDDDWDEDEEEEAWDEDELKAMSLGELKATAKEWGVPTARKNKKEIIKALMAENG